MKLYNLTAHRQNPAEWVKFGFDIEPEPRIGELPLDNHTEVCRAVKKALSDIPEGSALLIGGAQIITDYITLFAWQWGDAVFAAVTERLRDENDRFVFRLKGVIETPLSILGRLGGLELQTSKLCPELLWKGGEK